MRFMSCMLMLGMFLAAGCSPVPSRRETKEVLEAEVTEAIAMFKEMDPVSSGFLISLRGGQ